MRHYEIVLIIHPDQRDQLPAMLQRYHSIVESSGGTIHRQEDWGRRQLAYPINKLHKAQYILMNVECTNDALVELESGFRFNDAVLRNLIVKCDEAVTEPSAIAVAAEKREREPADHRSRSNNRTPRAEAKPEAKPAATEEPKTEAPKAEVKEEAATEAAPAASDDSAAATE
jgi:small subunit ribosomal protein S6